VAYYQVLPSLQRLGFLLASDPDQKGGALLLLSSPPPPLLVVDVLASVEDSLSLDMISSSSYGTHMYLTSSSSVFGLLPHFAPSFKICTLLYYTRPPKPPSPAAPLPWCCVLSPSAPLSAQPPENQNVEGNNECQASSNIELSI
jgi:hypothetical protein